MWHIMIETLITWVENNAWLLMAISLLGLVVGVLMVPVFVTRIPQDYFSHQHRRRPDSRHPVIRFTFLALKNLLGAVLVIAGILMLFLPGQGLLTLLVGLMIMNYPGKYALECWLIRRPKVLPAINWLRRKYNHPPLLPPEDK